MRTPAILPAPVVAIATSPMGSAQTPAPSPAGALTSVTLGELPTDSVATLGITRTTYAAGGALRDDRRRPGNLRCRGRRSLGAYGRFFYNAVCIQRWSAYGVSDATTC